MQKRLLNVAEYLLIAAMGVLFAFNYILFIVPNGFAPAGINGIAVMIQYKLNFSVAYMSLLINVPLCIAAYFYVDRTFAKKSLFFCIVYSAAYLLLQNAKGIERFCYNANNVDTIYPVIIAGLLGGFVYGVLFKGNACTGGTDIVARIVAKKEPRLNFFWVTFILNTVVAAASYFVYSEDVDGVTVYNMKPVCLCLFLLLFVKLRGLNDVKRVKIGLPIHYYHKSFGRNRKRNYRGASPLGNKALRQRRVFGRGQNCAYVPCQQASAGRV